MSSIPGLIASFFVNSIWQISFIAGAGWLLAQLAKRIGPTIEHLVWITTFGVAALVPAVPLLRRLLTLPFGLGASESNSIMSAIAIQSGEVSGGNGFELPSSAVVSLVLLYASFLLFFAARILWSSYCAIKLVRNAREAVLTLEQIEILRSCMKSFSLATVRVLNSRQISGPVTLGLRQQVLLLPEDFISKCTARDFLAACAHECAHIKRSDFNKNCLYEAAGLLVAFHPLVWMIKSKIAQTREMICDEMATETLINSTNYIRSLLRLATMMAVSPRNSTVHAIGIFDADILERRVMMIKTKTHFTSGRLRISFLLGGMLSLCFVGAAGAVMAVAIEPADSSQAATQGKTYGHVYRVGKDVTAPIPTYMGDAKFPKAALGSKDKFEGVCLIGLVVDASGEPRDVHVVRSLRPDFDANAIKAVQKYHFKPAIRLGTPVAVAVNVEVKFKRY